MKRVYGTKLENISNANIVSVFFLSVELFWFFKETDRYFYRINDLGTFFRERRDSSFAPNLVNEKGR